MKLYYFCFLPLAFLSCKKNSSHPLKHKIDVQGHRGARGLYPENSLIGMIKAVEMGVNTLELDVVISKDQRVILSHEPFLNHEICLDTLNQSISVEDERRFNLYQMNYSTIKTCDCGTPVHPRFPKQKHLLQYKPLLSELLDSVENYISENQLSRVNYNIEIKSQPATDSIYHPSPKQFVDLVMKVVNGKNITNRTTIQSFDVRSLKEVKENFPDVSIALLVEKEKSAGVMLDSLGFKPDIYSCDFTLIDKSMITQLQEQNIKVIPWTVNHEFDIQKCMTWGVDGIISDYPDRVISIIEQVK